MKEETTNPTDTNPEKERPEPFATILDLMGEHGINAVLESLADKTKFDADETEFSPEVRREAAYLHLELSQLLVRYDLLFPIPEVPEPSAPHFYP
jgi:hypothetical protein